MLEFPAGLLLGIQLSLTFCEQPTIPFPCRTGYHRPALVLTGWPASAYNWCCVILLRLVPLWRDARSLADWGPFSPSMPFLDAFHLMEPLSASFPPDLAISIYSRHPGGGTLCSIPVVTYLRIFCQRGLGIFAARPFSSCGLSTTRCGFRAGV
jgi:hypothetical protein